jgi:putative ABC transport system ATP-binding protein
MMIGRDSGFGMESLRHEYESETEEVETTALNNVNFEVKKGEFVSIMGPSGCGKSTLLNLIDELTVHENIELPLRYQKVPTSDRKKRATENINGKFHV